MWALIHRPFASALPALAALALTAAGLALTTDTAAHAANGVPRFDHVVIVMEENHSYNEIISDTTDAPYINNTLAAGGAVFADSFAVEHPSEPNYLDLFSGSNQGVTSDSCPHTFSTTNEGAQLIAAGDSFAGYSEGLPSAGSTVCTSGEYARKHVPWTNFSDVPASDSLPWTSFPSSSSFASLPTVSWVIPNLLDDMHDGTIAEGDTWLRNNIDPYAQWAKTHNSLLIVTWDEDDSSQDNQIPTIFYGANLTPGSYGNMINHYSVLRTIEDMYGLPYAGAAASATSITNVWSGVNPVTGGCTAQQLLGNPGFETGGAAPWTSTSGVISNHSQEPPHSGSWDAWMDGYGTTHTDTLSQPVSIPTGCATATFSFWLHIDTAKTTTSATDTCTVQVLSGSGAVLATLATFSNLNAASGYAQHSYNLAPFIGQSVTLKFTGSEVGSGQTSFVDDDNALNVS